MAVDTKGLIVQVATNLFREKSYLGVGITEIINACNLSKGAFYHHFPKGKEELLVTCLHTMNDTITLDMSAIFGRHETTQAAIIATLEELILQYERDQTIIGYTFRNLVSEMGSLSPTVQEACQTSYTKIQAIYYEKLVADGFTEEKARELSIMINATIEGGIMLCLIAKDVEPLQTISNYIPHLIKAIE